MRQSIPVHPSANRIGTALGNWLLCYRNSNRRHGHHLVFWNYYGVSIKMNPLRQGTTFEPNPTSQACEALHLFVFQDLR